MKSFKKGDVIVCIDDISVMGEKFKHIHVGGVYKVHTMFHGDVVLEKDDDGAKARVYRSERFELKSKMTFFDKDMFTI